MQGRKAHVVFTHRATLIDSAGLSSKLSPEETAMAEDGLAMEALKRGARTVDLASRIRAWRDRRAGGGVGTLGVKQRLMDMPAYDLGAESSAFTLVGRVEAQYRNMVQQEFSKLPDNVKVSFGSKDTSPFEHYLGIRSQYYQAGYSNPADAIFSKIQPCKFLGHNVIGGLHEVYVKALNRLPGLLDSWSPGLATRIGQGLKSVCGFVPREIAKTAGETRAAVLSNHAFGLALDIDPLPNPRIADQRAIAILKEVTGYDFGKPFISDADSAGMPAFETAMQVHMRADTASKAVQRWVSTWLPIYEEQEKIAKARKKDLFAYGSSSEPTISSEVADLEKAANVERMRLLIQIQSREYVRAWAQQGIQTIPIYLAAAMVQIGTRWGSTYKDSKDGMHFELLASNVIPPDAKKRTLDQLYAGMGM